jgi:hypothetical protein
MAADVLKSSLDKLLCFLYATGYSTVLLVTPKIYELCIDQRVDDVLVSQ